MALAIFEVMRALETRSPKQMSAPHRLVLLVLADHARDSDRAWPSISRLVAMTGLCRAKVISCINELEAAGWVERQGLTTSCPGGRASTMYVVRANGGDVSRPARETFDPVTTGLPDGPVHAVDRSTTSTGPRHGRQGSTAWTSGVHGMDVRGPRGGPKSLMESPSEAPSEDHPPIPPAGGVASADAERGDGSPACANREAIEPVAAAPAVRSDVGGATVASSVGSTPPAGPGVLPGFASLAPAPSPAKSPRRAARRPTRAADEPPAGQRYAEAYAQGQTDATGAPFAVPPQKSVFWPILKAYALDVQGQPLTGDAVLAWIRASSAEYRRAKSGQETYEKGFPPGKWAEWLQAGKPRSGAGRRAPQFQGGRIDEADLAAQQRRRSAELEQYLKQDAV